MAGYNLGITDYGGGSGGSTASSGVSDDKLKKFGMVKDIMGMFNKGGDEQPSFQNDFIGKNSYNPTNINQSMNPDLQMFDAAKNFSKIGADMPSMPQGNYGMPNGGGTSAMAGNFMDRVMTSRPEEQPINAANLTFNQDKPASEMSPPWLPMGQYPQTAQNPTGAPSAGQPIGSASYRPQVMSAGGMINPEAEGVARASSMEDMQRALMGQGWGGPGMPTKFENPSISTAGYSQEQAALKAGGEAEKKAYEDFGTAKMGAAKTAEGQITGQQTEFNKNARSLMGEQADLRKDAAELQTKYKQLPANEIWAGVSTGRKIAAYFAAFGNGFTGRGGNPVAQIIDDVRETQQKNFNNEWTSFKNRQELTLQDLKSQMDFGDQNMKFTKSQYDMIMAGAEGQFAKGQGEVAKQNALAASARAYQNSLNVQAENKSRNNQLLMSFNSMMANLSTNKLAVNFGPDANGVPVVLQAHSEADLPGLQATAGLANQLSMLQDLRNRVNNGLINHQEANDAYAQFVLNDPTTSPEAKAQYQKNPELLNYFSPDKLQRLEMQEFNIKQQLHTGMQRYGQPATIRNPLNQYPGTGMKTPEVPRTGARPVTASPEPRLTPNIKMGR